MEERELVKTYKSMEGIYRRVLDDVLWHLNLHFSASASGGSNETSEAGKDATKIYTSSKVSHRVKPFESLWRKSLREAVASPEELPSKIEDLLGIRIATANKDQARALFEYFRGLKDSWFCPTNAEPSFVPYTISDKNKYSLETGYQAYHITFVYDKSYHPAASMSQWPVEIQVMSQLWEFWADYSRRYFYGGSEMAARLLPYNVAISKILDSADDLMVATTDILLQSGKEGVVVKEETAEEYALGIDGLRAWFSKRVAKFFGESVRTPTDLFLSKILEELTLYEVTLQTLDAIFQSAENSRRYNAVLSASGVSYLPPYQQILCRILIHLGWDDEKVVDRVNQELRLQGIHLVPPIAR